MIEGGPEAQDCPSIACVAQEPIARLLEQEKLDETGCSPRRRARLHTTRAHRNEAPHR
jgi:hypothetical protein